jgi:hypothetical protein
MDGRVTLTLTFGFHKSKYFLNQVSDCHLREDFVKWKKLLAGQLATEGQASHVMENAMSQCSERYFKQVNSNIIRA